MTTTKLSQDNHVTLRALEVLSLIADHVERHGNADPEDIDVILRFFRETAHPCLDRALSSHKQADEMLAELEECFKKGQSDEFLQASRRYTNALGDVMFKTRVDRGTAEETRKASRTMHRLESKYVSPHLI